MTSPSKASKRKLDHNAPISPPPLRRKLQSNTTRAYPINTYLSLELTRRKLTILIETAVASFFTPSSQKPPEKITWHERAPNDDTPDSLVVGKYEPAKDSAKSEKTTDGTVKRHKIAAFDFVSWSLIAQVPSRKLKSDVFMHNVGLNSHSDIVR